MQSSACILHSCTGSVCTGARRCYTRRPPCVGSVATPAAMRVLAAPPLVLVNATAVFAQDDLVAVLAGNIPVANACGGSIIS